jgi:uncharacterized membrane protein YedE/YeeE
MKVLSAALFGLLFGAGLIVSGMTDPARVIGFLDVTGAWNPALAFVMGGAVVVALPAFAFARRGGASALGGAIELPPDRFRIDRRLLAGAAIFGVGWGLVGVCPGPSLVLFGQDPSRAALFVGAMIVGAWIAGRRASRRAASPLAALSSSARRPG